MILHFRLPSQEIEKKVNQHFGDVLFEGNVGDLGVWARVKKRQPIEVTCKNGNLEAVAQLEVYAKLRWKELLLGGFDILTPKVEETTFEITAIFSTEIQATPEWNLQSKTMGTFSWDKKPKVGVGILKVKVSRMLQPLIMSEIQSVGQRIDNFIQNDIDLRDKILVGWNFFRNPIALYEDPPVFGVVFLGEGQPVATPITCEDNEVRGTVSVPVNVMAYVKKGYTSIQRPPLPAFHSVAMLPKEFAESIETEIDFLTLCQTYGQQEFTWKNVIIRTKGMGMKCKNRRINISFSLDINYRLGPISRKSRTVAFISAEPYIDEEGKIRVRNLDLELLTPDNGIKAYLRFRRKKIISLLEHESQALIDRVDEYVREELSTHLNTFHFHPNLTLQGNLVRFFHEKLIWQSTSIKVVSHVKGDGVISIEL